MPIWIWILLALIAVWVIVDFNKLVSLRNRAQGAWSDIDVQLKRRHDLVGNLVETVKGYAAHERNTLESVTVARSRAEAARADARPASSGQAESALTGEIGRLIAVAEAYPDLKASDRFLDLQRALVEVEDALQNARRYYNAVVRDLNTKIEQFPSNVVAGVFGFQQREFFEAAEAERETPKVSF